MQFKIGDYVVHAQFGIGQVVEIEEKQFAGEAARLFYAVAMERSTVWVPVTTDPSANLRSLVTRKQLPDYRNLLRSRPVPLNPDRRQRSLELTGRLRQGSFAIHCEVIRDLSALGWPKALSSADNTLLNRAQEAICQEWAKATGQSILEISQEVTALLQEGRRLYYVPAPSG
ncbi:MAG: hypothetical protein JNL09_05365 [Anaerolineales bacterium]|nr:hypothetical protein [Anaerolineales bacterium]